MTLLEIITATGARVSDGSDYLWNCYGPNSRYIDFVDVASSDYCSVVFDCRTQTVYEVNLHVPGQDQAFKWINPDFESAYVAECAERGIESNVAWDSVKYTMITEDLVMSYTKDIGDMYYDDLPVPEEHA